MSTNESNNPSDFCHDSTEQRILVGLSKVSLALKSQSWQDAGRYGLSPTQVQILSLLQTKGHEGMGLSAVAEGLAVTPATASDAVRVLVEKGLVQKKPSPEDKRAIAITLTAKGQQLAIKTACWSDLLLDAVGELSELEQTVFLRGLIKMIRKLQEAGQIPISKMCVTCRFFQPNRYPNSDRPHHCALVDAPFGDRHLQIDCPDQIMINSRD
ncbi:MarR family transcriptional regulator [Hydrococcus rivularis NIES-593]|uniref:MarR family transcriptional regulator n=1 Tax=Hydrococcus rivularis NIES-593 TaxID=1921803 RepID=A0A1U7HDT2_9CYAN|nr:MarR family winged helix-turn-helix transcriptional regulator [Hydrococcus rivularis]OKH21701.1 MarR family transcriptional regulator [Hydrococcus rivularis NIES-593]